MAYNDKKILQVLKDELSKVEEEDRCDGYKRELLHLLAEVLNLERDHMIARTYIVQKIADEVNTVGMFLYKHQPTHNNDGDG